MYRDCVEVDSVSPWYPLTVFCFVFCCVACVHRLQSLGWTPWLARCPLTFLKRGTLCLRSHTVRLRHSWSTSRSESSSTEPTRPLCNWSRNTETTCSRCAPTIIHTYIQCWWVMSRNSVGPCNLHPYVEKSVSGFSRTKGSSFSLEKGTCTCFQGGKWCNDHAILTASGRHAYS